MSWGLRCRTMHGGCICINGPHALAPGITLHPPGPPPGLRSVRVRIAHGWLVVVSGVTHFDENMEAGGRSPAFHIGGVLEGFDLLRAVAPSQAHIVPGHDPEVMRRYRPPRPELADVVVLIDEAPSSLRKEEVHREALKSHCRLAATGQP
jgi:hypothetical protein